MFQSRIDSYGESTDFCEGLLKYYARYHSSYNFEDGTTDLKLWPSRAAIPATFYGTITDIIAAMKAQKMIPYDNK